MLKLRVGSTNHIEFGVADQQSTWCMFDSMHDSLWPRFMHVG
jgi:hypothetical protein